MVRAAPIQFESLRKSKSAQVDKHVKAWQAGIPAASQFVSVMTILEIETGILRIERRDPAQFLADIDRAIRHAQCISFNFNQPELDQPLHIVIDIAVIAPELPGQLTN